MKRFVLLHRGNDPDPSDLAELASIKGVQVIDSEIPRALLVEGTEEGITEVRRRLRKWSVAEEIDYPLPDTEC